LFKQAGAWITVASPDVNNPVSPFFRASQVPDTGTMLVTNGLNKQWCGALVKNKRTVPILNGAMLPYIAFHLKVRLPGITWRNLARLETDLKVCTQSRPNASTPIQNVANFSTQWNGDTGNWQIDPTNHWVDVAGANTPQLDPDVWHILDLRFWMDPTALLWSVLSIQWDDTLFQVPASQQKCAFMTTNWEATANLQCQNEGFNAGSVEVEYDEGVLAWSDAPIGSIPQPGAPPAGIDTFFEFDGSAGADDPVWFRKLVGDCEMAGQSEGK